MEGSTLWPPRYNKRRGVIRANSLAPTFAKLARLGWLFSAKAMSGQIGIASQVCPTAAQARDSQDRGQAQRWRQSGSAHGNFVFSAEHSCN